jgi:sortase A
MNTRYMKNNDKSRTARMSLFHKLLLLTILLALLILGKGMYMQGKAFVAQQLLTFAWARHMQDGNEHKAWPWADSSPIAQLTITGQDPLIILSGTSGENLAFAPTWMVASAAFNQGGNSVLVAHNDTHFKQLRNIELDSNLTINAYPNLQLDYRIIETKVVHEKDLSVLDDSEQEILTLITCYPFDSDTFNSELRFVVIAKRIKQTSLNTNLAWVKHRFI